LYLASWPSITYTYFWSNRSNLNTIEIVFTLSDWIVYFKIDVRTANSGTLVNKTNTQNFAFKSSSESTNEFSHRQTLTISKTSHLGQRTLGN
jgi:hypothetical protein